MKKFWITLLSVLMLVTCVAFAASCKKDKDVDVLANYVLTEDGTLVNDDFVLPLTVSGKEVAWESDNAAITLEKRAEDYLAKVTLGDEAKTVKLTVKCGDKSKEFEVTVGAFDVYYFSKNYTFKQENATVYSTFDLDTSVTINGKTASISWSVKEDYAEYIKISEDGTKCYVFESVKEPEVRISATFTYNEQTTKVPYRMTVSVKRDHLEEINSYYYNMGSTMNVTGYVVAFGEAWTEKYGNVSFYMVDEDFCTGYYVYHIKTTEADAALLTEGTKVTVSSIKSTTYGGLVESTQNQGELVVQKDDAGNVIKISDEDKAKLVYALDNDLLAGAPAAIYQTGRMISLDKWTVKEVKGAPKAGATATLFSLEKNGIEVTVAVSKYLIGVYDTNNADDAVYSALCAKQGDVQVGSVVSITGILSKYNDNYQILPLKADDIVVGGEATPVPEACTNVKAAIAAVNEAIKDNTSLTADKSFNLPTTSDGGVAIKYELLHTSTAVTLEGGAVTVKVGAEDVASIKVTYTVKNGENVVYETCTFFTINSKSPAVLSDADKAQAELDKVEATLTVSKDGDTPLAASSTEGIKLEWEVKAGTTLPDGVTLAEGKLNVAELPAEEAKVVLVATATCGTATKTKEVTVTIEAAKKAPEGSKSINFNDVDTGEDGKTVVSYAADTVIADIITLKGGQWDVDGNTGEITDAAGNAVAAKNRLKSKGIRTMDINLSTYTGKVQLQFFVRTGSNSDLERGVSLASSDGTKLGELILTASTMFTFEVTVDGGAVYTLSVIKNGVNFYGINVIPQAASNPPVENPIATSVKLSFAGVKETNGTAITDGDCTDLIKEYVGSDKGLVSASIVKGYKGSGSGTGVTETSGCLKFGTGKASGSLTLTFDKAVAKVSIECRGWGANDTVSITDGGTDNPKTLAEAKTPGTTVDTIEFVLSEASDVISIVTSNRAIISEIVVTLA